MALGTTKFGIYGIGREWAKAWILFRRKPSRGGRGRGAAVYFVACSGCGGIACFLLRTFVFLLFERARPAASMRTPCQTYLPNSTGVRTGWKNLICLSTCRWACVTFVVVTDCQSCTRPTSTNPDLWRLRAEGWGVCRRTPSRGGHGRRAAVHFVVCSGCGGIACFLLRTYVSLLFERARPAASMRTPCQFYLPNSTGVRTGWQI